MIESLGLDAGRWSLGPGCWFLATGLWLLVAGFWSHVPGYWINVAGLDEFVYLKRKLDFGHSELKSSNYLISHRYLPLPATRDQKPETYITDPR